MTVLNLSKIIWTVFEIFENFNERLGGESTCHDPIPVVASISTNAITDSLKASAMAETFTHSTAK